MTQLASLAVFMGIAAYAAFFVFCAFGRFRGIGGRWLLVATGVTALWLLTPLIPQPGLYLAFEALALTCWIGLVLHVIGFHRGRIDAALRPMRVVAIIATGTGVTGFVAVLTQLAGFADAGMNPVFHVSLLISNITGLVLIEQLARNAVAEYQWRVRYLNIALVLVFGFGSALHALTLFAGYPLPALTLIQPGVMALITPLLVVASLRNRATHLRLSLSRAFVFRSGVLIATGMLLVMLGGVGYLAQLFAGDVGLAIGTFVGIAVLTFALVLMGSSRIRSLVRVTVAKTFFEYRYDYRNEWLKVTARLTEPSLDFDLAQQVQRSLMTVLHAKRSCLWVREDSGTFKPVSHMDAPKWHTAMSDDAARALDQFYADSDWVLDRHSLPQSAKALNVCFEASTGRADVRFVIPLLEGKRLFGVCCIGASEAVAALSWEDFDILRLISRQCTGVLALQRAHDRIVEQEQFAAVNQMSAFLLHDIKTIAAQLKLLLENAARHKHNPAFIDDMLSTTQHSVARMERIIGGLRNPLRQPPPSAPNVTDVGATIETWLSECHAGNNRIRVERGPDMVVRMAPDGFSTVLNHLVQNCLDAAKDDAVILSFTRDARWAYATISDSGPGMSQDFIAKELFKPFHSSKGLSGMGIGAYQARSLIEQAGGDLSVMSAPGEGSTFTIKLPLAKREDAA